MCWPWLHEQLLPDTLRHYAEDGPEQDAEENPDTITRAGREAASVSLCWASRFVFTKRVLPQPSHVFPAPRGNRAAERRPVKVEVGDEGGRKGVVLQVAESAVLCLFTNLPPGGPPPPPPPPPAAYSFFSR